MDRGRSSGILQSLGPLNLRSPSALPRGGAALKSWELVELVRIGSLVAALAWAWHPASEESAIALAA